MKLFYQRSNGLLAILTACLLLLPNMAAAQTTPAAPEAPVAPRDAALQQAIDTALAVERETAEDRARVVFVLINFGVAKEAAPVLEELTKLDLEPAAKAKLVSEFGVARFLKLAKTEALQPAAKTFALACLDAAQTTATDSDRLSELINKLAADENGDRLAAMAALRAVGEPAVPACLMALAKSDSEQQQNLLRETLVRLAPFSTPALIASLDAPSAAVRANAAWALGQIGSTEAAPRLATLALTQPAASLTGQAAAWSVTQFTNKPLMPELAMGWLKPLLKRRLAGVPVEMADAVGRVTIWAWTPEGKLISIEATPEEATLVQAARLASDHAKLAPLRESVRRQAMVLGLEAQSLFGEQTVLIGLKSKVDPADQPSELLLSGLASALENGWHAAAIELCEQLARRNDYRVLYTADAKPSPLANTLNSPYTSVRYAGLQAIMRLKPPTSFPGSSRVADSLIYFASAKGTPQAVVITSRTDRSATIAGYLMAAGIEPEIANRGDLGICLAKANADLDLILVDLGVIEPNVREVLFHLRRHLATGTTPIGLLASEGRLKEAKRIARDHENAVAFPRPHSQAVIAGMVQELRAIDAQRYVSGKPTAEQRLAQAKQARLWLAGVLTKGPDFYDLRSRGTKLLAAFDDAVDVNAAHDALVLIGTPDSQRRLLDTASLTTLPIAEREHAAVAFRRSVEKHGVMLTTKEILRQYDRYNASEFADEATQQVLGMVLDTIETRRNKTIEMKRGRTAKLTTNAPPS